MERFDAANACPECESVPASYTRHATACPEVGATGPHMHRVCAWCGHQWVEWTTSPRAAPPRLEHAEHAEHEATIDIPALEHDGADLESADQ